MIAPRVRKWPDVKMELVLIIPTRANVFQDGKDFFVTNLSARKLNMACLKQVL